jgi:methionyl-tRNA formyltransferase
VLAASLVTEEVPEGEVAARDGEAILGCRDGSVRLEWVQPAGKKVLTGRAWMNGRRGASAVLDAP